MYVYGLLIQYEDPPKHIADDIAEAKRRLAQRKHQEDL